MAFRQSGRVTALEYSPFSLKFVEMLAEGRRVTAAGSVPLDPARWRDPGHLAAQARIALALTESRGLEGRIACSLPSRHAFLRVVEVPEDERDPAEAARWDLARYLARPLEAYALDWQPFEEGSRRHCLIAAYRRSEVLRLRETLESVSDLAVTAVDVDVLSAVNAFAANYPEFLGDRTLILKADRHAVASARTRGGNYLGGSVRGPEDPGAAAEAGAQESAELLLERAQAAADCAAAAEAAWGRPDRIALCGDLAGDPDFAELLRARLDEPFSLLDPFRKFPAPEFGRGSGASDPACAAALGLALRETGRA